MAPTAMTRQQHARQVTLRLSKLQEQRVELELVQLANDDIGTDPMTWYPPKTGPGGAELIENDAPVFPTYDERFAELAAAEARVWKYAEERDITRLVEAMIEAERARAEVEELSTIAEES